MVKRLRFPIRLKMLLAVLFVVTAVVSVITYTMANLFHTDKRAYVHDLSSVLAQSIGEEAEVLLTGYSERLQAYARIMHREHLPQKDRQALLRGFFDDFPELVAVALYSGQREIAAAYSAGALQMGNLDKATMFDGVPLDTVREQDVWLRNSSRSQTLPTLTMAMIPSVSDADDPLTVVGVIALDGLLQLSSRKSGFEIFLVDAEGTFLAHPDGQRVVDRESVDLGPEAESVHGDFSAAMSHETGTEGDPMVRGLAGVSFDHVTAAAQISLAVARLANRELLTQLLNVALALLFGATVVSLFLSHRLTRPVERLSEATQAIAKGQFDVKVDVTSRDEIGHLAGSFNQMAHELDDREKALKEAQTQLVQSEKLAAFGQLGAGIAHEVKNPLAGILGCAQLTMRKVERDTPVYDKLKLIEKETKRCKTIIENLLKFARQEKASLEPIHVNPVCEDAAAIVNHQLELGKVKLIKDLGKDLPMIHGNANQLQQVLMNLMMNAQQAMEGEPGEVRICTRVVDGHVVIWVVDNGPGIPGEIQGKLFEPFFTTKPGGKGTGLGLSVSYGIVKEHNGDLAIDSKLGEGATFVITIPAMAEDASSVAGETASVAGAEPALEPAGVS